MLTNESLVNYVITGGEGLMYEKGTNILSIVSGKFVDYLKAEPDNKDLRLMMEPVKD